MRLDLDRPYGTVSGLPGVCFQQDGRYFGRNGHPVRDPEGSDDSLVLTEEVAPKPMSDDLRFAENKRLKAQLAIYGEEWTGAAAAKRFLEGKGA